MDLIKTVLDGNYTDLKDELEQTVAKKLYSKINDEKVNVLAGINGIKKEKMAEIMAAKKPEET